MNGGVTFIPEREDLKRFQLKRISRNETGTYGVLEYNSVPFAVTAELPDLCNENSISCIPAGKYILFKRLSPSRNYEVYEFKEVPGRKNIQCHKGNVAIGNSKGCILIAERFDKLGHDQAVLDSQHGFAEFMQLAGGDNEIYLEILERY